MVMPRHVPGSIQVIWVGQPSPCQNVHMSSRQNRSAIRRGGLGSIDPASISESAQVSSNAQLILQSVCEKLCHSRSMEMMFRFSGDILFRLVSTHTITQSMVLSIYRSCSICMPETMNRHRGIRSAPHLPCSLVYIRSTGQLVLLCWYRSCSTIRSLAHSTFCFNGSPGHFVSANLKYCFGRAGTT
jgi:hypothetical protein